MIRLDPYLNFMGRTEEAFNFYKTVFGGEIMNIQKFKDVPGLPQKDKMSPADLDKVMHVALKVGNNVLMGTDALESLGHKLTVGNNISLSLQTDSKEEAGRLYSALGVGGKSDVPMMEMFWGYFGMVDDAYGIKWMINYDKNAPKL